MRAIRPCFTLSPCLLAYAMNFEGEAAGGGGEGEVSRIDVFSNSHPLHHPSLPHKAISVKTVHQLIANDRQNCGLWVN